jgi:hypothetical protein
MLVKNFEDLKIWKEARRLTQEVYRLTRDSKFAKDFSSGIRFSALRSLLCQTL